MSMEIYYFSGTGNSLWIARMLAERMPDSKLVPIIGCLSQDQIRTNADAVGIVFPLHAFTLPIPVRAFLHKADFGSARFIFGAATKGGSPSIAYGDMNKLLGKKDKRLNAYFEFKMANNLIIMHGLDSPEEIAENKAQAEKDLEIFARAIQERTDLPWNDPDANGLAGKVVFPFVGHVLLPKLGQRVYPFRADENCTGCGVCGRVCLSGRIQLNQGKPEWRKEVKCCFCFACVNYCPVRAIQIGKTNTPALDRYHFERIHAQDIAAQKRL